MVYTTKDFISFALLPNVLHSVEWGGMWECVELYPVAVAGPLAGRGLDILATSPGKNVKHVLKVSVNDEWHDYYVIGTYDLASNTWTPDDESIDVGMGWRYDWGKFYASRTFYDQVKHRRVLWGYVGEVDSRSADIQKGWASFQVYSSLCGLFSPLYDSHARNWNLDSTMLTTYSRTSKLCL